MRRIATAAALVGLMLTGIGTAAAVSAHDPAAAAGPVLLHFSGSDQRDQGEPSPGVTPSPSPSATPENEPAEGCAEDRAEDVDEAAEEANEIEDCPVEPENGVDRQRRGPDQSGQRGPRHDDRQGDDRGSDGHGSGGSEGRD